MMKKLMMTAMLMLVLVLAACGSNADKPDNNAGNGSDEPEETANFEEVYNAVETAMVDALTEDGDMTKEDALNCYIIDDLTNADSDDPMVEMTLERLEIDPAQLANGKFIAAMMNINSDEIIVLEAKDEADVATLKTALENELEAQDQTWSQYLPDQHEKVKNNVITTEGNFLLYVTFSAPDQVVDAFKAQFE